MQLRPCAMLLAHMLRVGCKHGSSAGKVVRISATPSTNASNSAALPNQQHVVSGWHQDAHRQRLAAMRAGRPHLHFDHVAETASILRARHQRGARPLQPAKVGGRRTHYALQ